MHCLVLFFQLFFRWTTLVFGDPDTYYPSTDDAGPTFTGEWRDDGSNDFGALLYNTSNHVKYYVTWDGDRSAPPYIIGLYPMGSTGDSDPVLEDMTGKGLFNGWRYAVMTDAPSRSTNATSYWFTPRKCQNLTSVFTRPADSPEWSATLLGLIRILCTTSK